jgi:hypothetical protein
MAKRARGTVRPGQRRPIDRRPLTPGATGAAAAATPRTTGLSEAELARAAELEAQLLAEERSAEVARKRSVERVAVREAAPSRVLAFEDEYAYVAHDVRDIVRIAALLFTVLFGLWILIDVLEVIRIG